MGAARPLDHVPAARKGSTRHVQAHAGLLVHDIEPPAPRRDELPKLAKVVRVALDEVDVVDPDGAAHAEEAHAEVEELRVARRNLADNCRGCCGGRNRRCG